MNWEFHKKDIASIIREQTLKKYAFVTNENAINAVWGYALKIGLIKKLDDNRFTSSERAESLKGISDEFDGAIRETIKAESDEVSKIRVTNGSVSEFRGEIEKLSEVIKTMQADILQLDKKEVTIQYDSEVGSLREDFEKFKKIALTVDDKI